MDEDNWMRVAVRDLEIDDEIRYHQFEGRLRSIDPTTDPSRVVLTGRTPAGTADSLQLDLDWKVLRYAPPESSSSSSE